MHSEWHSISLDNLRVLRPSPPNPTLFDKTHPNVLPLAQQRVPPRPVFVLHVASILTLRPGKTPQIPSDSLRNTLKTSGLPYHSQPLKSAPDRSRLARLVIAGPKLIGSVPSQKDGSGILRPGSLGTLTLTTKDGAILIGGDIGYTLCYSETPTVITSST